MAMHPAPERTRDLFIIEAERRSPVTDQGLPAEWNTTQPQSIIDRRTDTHRDRSRRDDPKAQRIGCDALEIERIAEEGEDLLGWLRQPDLRVECVYHGDRRRRLARCNDESRRNRGTKPIGNVSVPGDEVRMPDELRVGRLDRLPGFEAKPPLRGVLRSAGLP